MIHESNNILNHLNSNYCVWRGCICVSVLNSCSSFPITKFGSPISVSDIWMWGSSQCGTVNVGPWNDDEYVDDCDSLDVAVVVELGGQPTSKFSDITPHVGWSNRLGNFPLCMSRIPCCNRLICPTFHTII